MVALTIRARVATARGEPELARDDAHAALACGAELHIYQGMPDAMELLAGLAGEVGSHSEGVRLLGAAAALRQQTRQVRFKIWDAGYQASVTALREAMGDEDFDRAWAEGPPCPPTRRSHMHNAVAVNASDRPAGGAR